MPVQYPIKSNSSAFYGVNISYNAHNDTLTIMLDNDTFLVLPSLTTVQLMRDTIKDAVGKFISDKAIEIIYKNNE